MCLFIYSCDVISPLFEPFLRQMLTTFEENNLKACWEKLDKEMGLEACLKFMLVNMDQCVGRKAIYSSFSNSDSGPGG